MVAPVLKSFQAQVSHMFFQIIDSAELKSGNSSVVCSVLLRSFVCSTF